MDLMRDCTVIPKDMTVNCAEIFLDTDASGCYVPERYFWRVQAFDSISKKVSEYQSSEIFAKFSEARLDLNTFLDILEGARLPDGMRST